MKPPLPAWADEEEPILRYTLARIADDLVAISEDRMRRLQDNPTPDLLLLEAKKELAAAAVDGNMARVQWALDAIEELLYAYTHR